jgi:hypothetical protein
MMKKVVLLLSLIVPVFMLWGCSSVKEEAPQELKSTRMTVVSSGKPSEVLPAFKTFTWHEDYNKVLSAVNQQSKAEVKEYIRDEIIRYLNTKGYVYQPDPIQADVVIGFLFALEDDLADQQIQERFGLLPGINTSDVTEKRYEKGSFLLAVLDTRVKLIYWRSAMQGFVDFEKDKNDDSIDHMQDVLSMMLGGFPKAGQ